MTETSQRNERAQLLAKAERLILSANVSATAKGYYLKRLDDYRGVHANYGNLETDRPTLAEIVAKLETMQ